MFVCVKDIFIEFFNGKIIHFDELDDYSQYCIKLTGKDIEISIRNAKRSTEIKLMTIPTNSLFIIYDKDNKVFINFE